MSSEASPDNLIKQPPKHRVWPRVTLFVTALAAVFALVNAFLQPIWPNASYGNASRAAFYEEPENTIQCVFVGASTFVSGISPLDIYEQTGINCYNLASELQPSLASYYWVKEAYRLHPKSLKVVVLDASMLRQVPPDSFYQKALNGMLPSSVKLEAIADVSRNPADFFTNLFPVASYHDRWSEMKNTDFYKFDTVDTAQTRGFSAVYSRQIDSMDETSAQEARGRIDLPTALPARTETTELNHEALVYLDRIVQFCGEHDLSLVVMRTPSVNWDDGSHYAVQDILDSYGIPLLDYYYGSDNFTPETCYATDTNDTHHLNYYGAMKLTSVVGTYLASLEQLQETQGETTPQNSDLSSQLNTWNVKRMATRDQWSEIDVTQYIQNASIDGRTVFVTVRDDASSSLTEHQRDSLAALDLTELSQIQYRDSYLAIIRDGHIQEEMRKRDLISPISSSPLTRQGVLPDGTTYSLSSGGLNQGDAASVVIGGTEYARNTRGINIVVYDNSWHKVVASTTFDTSAQAYRPMG